MILYWKLRSAWMPVALLAFTVVGCSRQLVETVPTEADDARDLRDVLETKTTPDVITVSTVEPTGFATLKGLFQVNRAVKALPGAVATGDDARFCSPNGTPMPDHALQVGADNGLANVAIWLTKPREVPENSKWIHEEYQATRDATLNGEYAFDQKNCVFLSRVFAMRSTQKVELLNSDSVLHNTKIDDPGSGVSRFNSGIGGGGKEIYEPGGFTHQPFKVSCSIHGWMHAWMLVRPNPFFAVSGPDGKFEIANIPAGVDLEFRVSHEGRFLDGKRVVATLNGQALPIKSGRIKLSGIEPGVDIKLEFVLDADAYGWK